MTIRLYGVNKYGDGKLYGHTDGDGLAWDVSIDWDEDNLFDANEAARLTSVSINRGRVFLLAPIGEGFEEIQTGEATIRLRNADGRFDGWNTSSPLYPNVTLGKDVRIRVRDLGDTDAVYPLLRGVISKIVPTGYGEDAQVEIHVSDGLDFLRNYTARVAIQTAITPDEAIGLILDSVGWPSAWGRDLDASSETIPYWWASGNKKAMSEAQDLATSFLGYFFADASGQARYIKRSSVADAVANYPQEYLLKDLGNPQPFEILRNITRIKVHPRTQAATGTIWQLVGNIPTVPPGAGNALTIFANYTYNNVSTPARNVITPVATTDFLINSQSDGLGTNLTASCTVSLTDFGDTGKLVITNNSATIGYVVAIKIRGNAIYEPNVSDITYPIDLSTVRNPRELVFDLPWQQDLNVAVDLSNVLGPFYSAGHPIPNIKIDSRPSLQFAPDLFDIVTADLGYIGLNGVSFRVGGIEHTTDSQFENCQRVITRLYLEPYVSADDYMQWDTNSVWDTSTVFGY